MEPMTIKERFLTSLERCECVEGFFPSFYARFASSSEQVKFKFRQTDFERQNAMLVKSLKLVAGVCNNETEALRELRERAESHDRLHMNIKPELYELWQQALLSTASATDPEWDEATERAWNTIIDTVVKHMVKHY